MNKLTFFFFFLLVAFQSAAQSTAKRYVFIEHFTNTRCGICAGRNPGFFTLIQRYPNDVHHIAVHPIFPYSNCIFYVAATADNTSRVNVYDRQVVGTPTYVIGGTPQSSVQESNITQRIAETSPIAIEVRDEVVGSTFSTRVQVVNYGAVPQGQYKLYLALVERRVDYSAPNGEKVHYNVLRQMLGGAAGTDFTALQAGSRTNVAFSVPIAAAWKPEQLAVVAFVQNTTTKAVLNSGTRFDPPLTSSVKESVVKTVTISPNPVQSIAQIDLNNDRAEQVEVFSGSGQRISIAFETIAEGIQIPVENLPKGIYLIKIKGNKQVYTGKFLKN
jgi:Outer membrane protein Omp28/Secretion system C-terminal sorting domain